MAAVLTLAPAVAGAQLDLSQVQPLPAADKRCGAWEAAEPRRDPTPAELRCRFSGEGPGRFGLSVYMEVPVYQPATPLPGTHVVGVPGLPGPWKGESFEEWEWRVLRTEYGAGVKQVHRGIEVVDPIFASRLLDFEARLREAGVHASRRETWRSPERQAYLFQQGRSRPGPLITATLTSWHSRVDSRGQPSSVAADYNVPRSQLPRFHEVAWMVGLESYGPESNDPGHVFLPGSDSLPRQDLILLRLLPRVPVVTLSTGRPEDEPVSREARARWRRASEEFAMTPFVRHPVVRLAGLVPAARVLAQEVQVPERTALQPTSRPGGRRTELSAETDRVRRP